MTQPKSLSFPVFRRHPERSEGPPHWSLPLLFCALTLTLPAHAAPPAPVHFHAVAPAHPIKAGTRFTLTLNASIDPGWHLYTLTEPEDGPIATDINLTEGDPAQFLSATQSKPRTTQDPVFAKPVTLFESTATFTLHLQLDRSLAPGQHPLHILVRYQSCNDHVCLPPHTETVEAPLATN